jgi:hypothetical protein
MQVSWIDSDQLNGLLKQLKGATPEVTPTPQAWEMHTLPDTFDGLAKGAEALVNPAPEPSVETPPEPKVEVPIATAKVEAKPVEAKPVEAPREVEEGVNETAPVSEGVAPAVERIRDRLREVRERAERAGLLRRPERVEAEVAAVAAVSAVPVAEVGGKESVVEGLADAVVAEQDEAAAVKPVGEAEVCEEVAEGGGGTGAKARVDEGLYFEVPLGTVVERLEAFAEWAQRRIQPGELLLLDEHGDVLWGAQAKVALVLSAMMAANAASRSHAASACGEGARWIRQAVGAGGELAVISCATRVGLIHLAVERVSGLADEEAALLRQALQSAVDVMG